MAGNALIHLGKISGVHGVKGWLKIYSFTRPVEGILDYTNWIISRSGSTPQSIKVADARKQGRGLLVKLIEINSRTDAEHLVGYDIYIERSDLPVAHEGECYWVDLIGLSVQTEKGVLLGKIQQIMETGANDVLVVRGDRERLIPYVHGHFVKTIDLENGMMTVDWDVDF